MLVVDHGAGSPTKMILRGAFNPRNFYTTTDAGFNPESNMFNTPFSKVEASCRLTPILGEPDEAPGNENDGFLSVFHGVSSTPKGSNGSQPFIKLSHSWFTVHRPLNPI
jgi:hypothetical protein